MITRRINAMLNTYAPYTWGKATPEIRILFCKQLRGLEYGWDALLQAWDFYCRGFIDGRVNRVSEQLSQINSERLPSDPVPEDLRLIRAAD